MATFNATIVESSDDARESSGTMTLTAVNLTSSTAGNRFGFRFQNVTIPQGSTISAATITVYLPSAVYDDPNVAISCEDEDDVGTFTTSANNISARDITSTVNWTATGLGTGYKASPDISTPVQTVINRAGWVSGNSMVIIFEHLATATAFRVNAYDGGGADYATLDVTYTAPAGGVPKHAMYYARARR